MIDAVIFDMDGVLIDSINAAHRAKTELLARHGIDVNDVPDVHNESHRGSSVRTLLQAVEKHHGVRIDETQFGHDAVELVYKNLQEDGVSADPTLVAFLRNLAQHDVVCAITTSGMRKSTDNKLRILGIAQYFKIVVTSDDVEEHKPSPASYLHTMEHLHARPERCIIFEDSAAGIEAGRAAGGIVIGYAGYHDHGDPLSGTRATIRSWSDISYEVLEKLVREN